MNTNNATATTSYISGYNCLNCGQWVNNYSTVPHICNNWQPQGVPAWPTVTMADPKLISVLERIASALEGLEFFAKDKT